MTHTSISSAQAACPIAFMNSISNVATSRALALVSASPRRTQRTASGAGVSTVKGNGLSGSGTPLSDTETA